MRKNGDVVGSRKCRSRQGEQDSNYCWRKDLTRATRRPPRVHGIFVMGKFGFTGIQVENIEAFVGSWRNARHLNSHS